MVHCFSKKNVVIVKYIRLANDIVGGLNEKLSFYLCTSVCYHSCLVKREVGREAEMEKGRQAGRKAETNFVVTNTTSVRSNGKQ